MIDGFNATPMISLPAFMFGFIAVLLIARAIAEYIEFRQEKSPSNRGNDRTSRQAQLSASQKTIQRYYNTYRKGA